MKKKFENRHEEYRREVTTKKELKRAISDQVYQITVTGDLAKKMKPTLKLMTLPKKKKQALLTAMIGGAGLAAIGAVVAPAVSGTVAVKTLATPVAARLITPSVAMLKHAAVPTALATKGLSLPALKNAVSAMSIVALAGLMMKYDLKICFETSSGVSLTFTMNAPSHRTSL